MRKGFTLVELIAVLVILSIIALIVTPNIMVSVKEYQEQLYETEIQALESAAKNWVADNISEVPIDNNKSLIITIQDLVENGYFDENATDPSGGKFDDSNHFTFVVVNSSYIEDELNQSESNYKYEYSAYTSVDEFLKKVSIKYAETNNITDDVVITTDGELKDYGYIRTEMLYTNWYVNKYGGSPKLNIGNKKITIEVTEKGKENKTYEYSVSKIENQ